VLADDDEFDRPIRRVVSYAERVLSGERVDADELPDLSEFAEQEPVVLEGPTELADDARVEPDAEETYSFTADGIAELVAHVRQVEHDRVFAEARRRYEGRTPRREQVAAPIAAPKPKRTELDVALEYAKLVERRLQKMGR